ncbi:hypothetical protein QIU19_10510 [Capnocytophaga canimorsus]|nr:hypothetical protein [Capnocytophaga canimorsus]WGU67851.1 hypothetical protein QIU19_10510 [Capnocytophaga canimorsus]
MKRTTAKESTSRLFKRYIWLIDLISRKQGITYEEINNRWLHSSLNEDEKRISVAYLSQSPRSHCSNV